MLIWWLLACGGPRPEVTLSPPDRDVAAVVDAHIDELQDCYLQHTDGTDVRGTVHLVWDVVHEHVAYVRIDQDTTGVPGLAACLRNRVFLWDFDDVPDETYQQTFRLSPPPR